MTDSHGVLSETALKRIVDQIALLKEAGHQVTLVSSGAMGAGKSLLKTARPLTAVSEKQLFSAVGQPHLMNAYSRLFANHELLCAQVLATKEDFRDRSHFFNMRNCLEILLHDSVVPIVNENDVVALDELMFTDNDELAGLVASMVNADLLLILSSVDGVMDADGMLVKQISNQDYEKYRTSVTDDKSEAGRGGMVTKFEVAKRAARQGIEVVIANGMTDGIVMSVMGAQEGGTRFAPGKRQSSARRRLAHSDSLVRGKAYVNECAADSLTDSSISSLLLVGVVRLEGEFEKGDVIEVTDPGGKRLGYGISQYSSAGAQKNIGKKNIKALIQYDYMFIE